jgi:hypothetical protein
MTPLTDADIKQFLEDAPLYEWREFKKPVANRSSLWIKEIDATCEVCEQPRPFQDLRSQNIRDGGILCFGRWTLRDKAAQRRLAR